jgi:hypothetical protein
MTAADHLTYAILHRSLRVAVDSEELTLFTQKEEWDAPGYEAQLLRTAIATPGKVSRKAATTSAGTSLA